MRLGIRLVIGALFIAICVLGVRIYWIYETESATNHIYEAFIERDYKNATLLLDEMSSDLKEGEFSLIKGYLVRSEEGSTESQKWFKHAENFFLDPKNKSKIKEKRLVEIHLNQALNAYIALDPKNVESQLEKLENQTNSSESIYLLKGWLAFDTQNFELAQTLWAEARQSSEVISPWWHEVQQKFWGDKWLNLYESLVFSYQGKTEQSEKLLNQVNVRTLEFENDWKRSAKALIALQKSINRPLTEQEPFLLLALDELREVDLNADHLPPTKTKVLEIWKTILERNAENSFWQDLPILIGVLDDWDAEKILEELQIALGAPFLALLRRASPEEIRELGFLFKEQLPNHSIQRFFLSLFEAQILNEIGHERWEGLEARWDLLEEISSPEYETRERIEDFLLKRIFHGAANFDDELAQMNPYIKFWKYLVPSGKEQSELALELVSFAQVMWLQQKLVDKGARLMEIAAELPHYSYRPETQRYIALVLKKIHESASAEDRLNELRIIYRLAHHFQLRELIAAEKAELANQVADVQFLMKKKNWKLVKERLEWILEVMPEHQLALALMGELSYEKKEYLLAYEHLKKVKSHDFRLKEMFAYSGMFAGKTEEAKKYFLEIKGNSKKLSRKAREQIGYILLMQGEPAKALKHLNRLERTREEPVLAKFVAFSQLEQPLRVLELFRELPLSYQRWLRVQTVYIESLAKGGQVDLAEKNLQELLQKREFVEPTDFYTPLFKEFYEKELQFVNLEAFAGKFYQVYLKDFKRALQFYEKAGVLSVKDRFFKAELFEELNRTEEAELLFKDVFRSSEQESLKIRASQKIIGIYEKQQRWDEASTQLEKIKVKEDKTLVQMIRAYLHLKQWPQAYSTLKKLKEIRNLAEEELVMYVISALRAGKFQGALRLADGKILDEDKYMRSTRLHLLQLVHPLISSKRVAEYIGVLKNEDESLSEEEKELLLSIFIRLKSRLQVNKLLENIDSTVLKKSPLFSKGSLSLKEEKVKYKTARKKSEQFPHSILWKTKELESFLKILKMNSRDLTTLEQNYLVQRANFLDKASIKMGFPALYEMTIKARLRLQQSMAAQEMLGKGIEDFPWDLSLLKIQRDLYMEQEKWEEAKEVSLKIVRWDATMNIDNWKKQAQIYDQLNSDIDVLDSLNRYQFLDDILKALYNE